MKRVSLKCIVILVVTLFSVSTFKAFAQPQLIIGNVPNANTAILTIPVTTNNFTQLLAIQGSINWDNTKLTYNSVTNLNAQLSGLTFGNSVSGNIGRLAYVWTDAALNPQTISNGSLLFNLRLNLVTTATGVSTISFSNTPTTLLISDQNINPVSGVIYTPGTVTIPWALPVKISAFTASKNNNAVTLNWATAEEKNVASFFVERSLNGTDFVSVSNINASGLDIPKQYSYVDALNTMNNTLIYYRIKVVDNDGRFTYSKTVTLKSDEKGTLVLVYPNPTKENLTLQVNSLKASSGSLQVINMEGKVVLQQQIKLQTGFTSIPLSVAELTKGSYAVIIKTSEITAQQMFIKD